MISKNKLLAFMTKAKLSMQDIASGVNINYATINRIVNGKTTIPRPETIQSISKFLGIDPSLICESDNIDVTSNNEYVIFQTVKDFLLFYMQTSGITPLVLERNIGIYRSTLDKILTSETKTPNLQTLQKFAEYFNLTIEQLTGKKPVSISKIQEVKPFTKCIPLINLNDVSQWLFGDYNSVNVLEYVHSTLLVNQMSFAFKIPNDIYEPEFFKNSILIVDNTRQIENGDVVIVKDVELLDMYVATLNANNTLFRKVGSNLEIPQSPTAEIIGVVVQEIRNLK